MRFVRLIFRWLFSRERQTEWNNQVSEELQHVRKVVRPYGEFLYQNPALWCALHFLSFSLVAETGSEWLEPAAISWFWAPFLALLLVGNGDTYPDTPIGVWVWKHPNLAYWIGWVINVAIVPAIFWGPLKSFDEGFAHRLREALGRGLGLGGQTGLLIAICTLLFLIAAADGVRKWRKRQ